MYYVQQVCINDHSIYRNITTFKACRDLEERYMPCRAVYYVQKL